MELIKSGISGWSSARAQLDTETSTTEDRIDMYVSRTYTRDAILNSSGVINNGGSSVGHSKATDKKPNYDLK
jgi:hypothetical protein